MARLSDLIEKFIKELIDDNPNDELELGRNELANHFSCAPSQINYVLTTRFSTEKGYLIESRRGGGGYIKIRKMEYERPHYLVNLINEKIGDSITYDKAIRIINSLIESDIINKREANIIKIAINDRTLGIALNNRNEIRANILKNTIMISLL